MIDRATKLSAMLAASAALVLLGCGEQSFKTVAVDFTVDVSSAARPLGSGVAIVGNAFSLGATADHPDGDPVHGLNLHLRPDGKYFASAWLPSDQDVTYTVYMTNPYAPMLDAPGGSVAEVKHVDFTKAGTGGEGVTVTAFDVPQNIVKPCVDFTVTVPANTPAGDPVYMAGSDAQMGVWMPGKFFTMTSGNNSTYSAHLCFNVGQALEYKYLRSSGDFSKVEKNADGSERVNRTLTVTEDVSHGDTVEKWADL